MDSTVSVSKGVFVFKNGMPKRSKIKKSKIKSKDLIEEELWCKSFRHSWNTVETEIESLHEKMFSNVVDNLIQFLRKARQIVHESLIPTAALLTGINLPDHGALFKNICTEIKSNITPHIALLSSEDCSNLKSMVENMIYRFINDINTCDEVDEEDSDDDNEKSIVKKTQCNFETFKTWYENKYPWEIDDDSTPKNRTPRFRRSRKILTIILPDFESLPRNVLHDFILSISVHLDTLPVALIFGVATSVETLHKTLPFQVTTKLNIQIFQTQQSVSYLNEVLENIFLTEKCPFHLSDKPFTLLTDVFLFYDFSVKGFIQGIKFAMLEHFYENNTSVLCCARNEIDNVLNQFTETDWQLFRKVPSFEKYIKSMNDENMKIKLLANDNTFKTFLKEKLNEFHDYLFDFHVTLRVLHSFTSKLPNSPLGKQLREYYSTAISSEITKSDDFLQCMKLLNFLSKDELLLLILNTLKMLNSIGKKDRSVALIALEFKKFSSKLNTAETVIQNKNEEDTENLKFDGKMSRYQFKEKLLELSKKPRQMSEYEQTRNEFFECMKNIFARFLVLPNSLLFHEVFFYDNVSSLKLHMVGSPRAAIHTALNDPQFYLQCDCCELTNAGAIMPTLPDLSIVYKLHLECGKFINMYDWLQAFVMIVETDESRDSGERDTVTPQLQARFTRAVAELQFLGFIKLSKKKTDHVMKLTWGSS